MTDYDVVRSFQRIEEELIQSMQVNMKRHIGEEFQEDINWTQWQAEMLRGLQTYKKENSIKLPGYFSTINDDIDAAIRKAYATGESEQEIEVLNAIKNGYKKASKNNMQGEFFKINANKLNALIDSTVGDFKKAEKAILRTTDDAYRKIIFNTQMFYTSGATSLWQSVDMASKDFLKAGINCVQYKNGSRVNIVSYAEMAMRTTNKRANLMGQANKRMEYGVHTVKINHRGTACPMCLQWLGQVYYDDVYGTVTPAERRGLAGLESYPLLSTAVEGGLFHPNCKDACSSYYEGISQPPKSPTEEEKQEALRRYGLEQEQRKCERNIRQYTRLEKGAMSSDDAKLYADKKQAWIAKYNNLVNSNTDVLRNDPARLRLYGLGGLSSGTKNVASQSTKISMHTLSKATSKAYNEVTETLKKLKVNYNAVVPFEKQLTDDEIISRLAGGDMTRGSCSSLAFAYCGNKNGVNALDFRDGESRHFFALNGNIQKMLKLPNVKGSITKVKKEAADTCKIIRGLEQDKEYYLAVGRHAAIIKNTENGAYYLELQSAYENGWKPFETDSRTMLGTLVNRFGARKTVDRSYGQVWEKNVVLMEVDSFKDNAEFNDILGYINTAVNMQRKGATGNVR